LSERYRVGFTRYVQLNEFVLLAQLFTEVGEWGAVSASVKQSNLFQTRTVRSSEVLFGELQKRLSLLSTDQIELVVAGADVDQRQLAWISICKQYPFIRDFMVEIVAPAVRAGRQSIDHDDYRSFFNAKAEWHPELDEVSDKTQQNGRGALFQMMRQCELLTETNQLIPQMLSAAIQNCTPDDELAYIPGAIRL